MLRMLADALLDLLAPPRCPGCDRVWQAGPGVLFCPACDPLIELAPAELQPPANAAALFRYQGPFADAVRRFKYARDSALACSLAAPFAQAALAYAGAVEAVVPMPLHPSKLRARGYNPSALLARPVARTLGVPLRVGWLQRRRATASQAGLDARQRAQNVCGAFWAPRARASRVLLLDDVRTTGATLSEAAATLRAQGHGVTTYALAWAPLSRSDPCAINAR